jgi:hypothetical protein
MLGFCDVWLGVYRERGIVEEDIPLELGTD